VTGNSPPWAEGIGAFVSRYAVETETGEIVGDVVQSVAAGVVEVIYPAGGDHMLMLLQIHNRTVEREEVFMGGVVFNDWLFKGLVRAVETYELGEAIGLTNDLETAYVLVATRGTADDVRAALRRHLQNELPALFFNDEAAEKGLHGTFGRMHGILNSQREPFPVYAVPRFLARTLEQHVRTLLQGLIAKPLVRTTGQRGAKPERKPSLDLRVIQTTMAYFYGRLSGGEYDCQSHDTFMTRLTYTYGVVSPAELRRAYNLSVDQAPDAETISSAQQRQVKDAIKESVRSLAFDGDELRDFLRTVLDRFGAAIDAEPDSSDTLQPAQQYLDTWLLPYLRANGKFVNVSPDEYLDAILHGITVGSQALAFRNARRGWPCRTCGEQQATVAECNILLGVAVNKFYNQLPNQKPATSGDRVCVRCALYSYLGTKLFGCTTSGSFPVPKQDNLIFHVGRHTQEQVREIGHHLERIVRVTRAVRELRYESLQSTIADDTREPFDREQAIAAIIDKIANEEELTEAELALFTQNYDRVEQDPGTRNILEQVADCQVIDLGMGDEQRLVAFALPKLPGDNDLTQKRFARARLTVYALIGFLQDICGCREHGAYFFRTVPRLEREFEDDVFYVEDHSVSGQQYRMRYRAAAAFAIGVTKTSKDFTASWLRLSERLSEEPLETFSTVLRDTGFRAGDDRRAARYVVPKGDGGVSYNDKMHVFGGWAYLKAFTSLHDLWEDDKQPQHGAASVLESADGLAKGKVEE